MKPPLEDGSYSFSEDGTYGLKTRNQTHSDELVEDELYSFSEDGTYGLKTRNQTHSNEPLEGTGATPLKCYHHKE